MEARALDWIQEKGGTAIGKIYSDGRYKRIKVQCSKNHIWDPSLQNLVGSKSWCPQCYGNVSHSIEFMRNLAKSRGGKLISDIYSGLNYKLEWECSFGHQWIASPNNVKNKGSWCPHCIVHIGEELVRSTLEEAFPGKKFIRTRREPWMGGLELDGYNAELKLAYEYQGIQHDKPVGHFHKTTDAFTSQIERDRLTKERCEANSVTLLLISHTIPYQKIRSYVREMLMKLKFDIISEKNLPDDISFYNLIRANSTHLEKQHARILEVIRKKGGEILPDTKYIGYRVPMKIKCQNGHIFEATPEAIDQPVTRGPRFCPTCGKIPRKLSDDEIIAKIQYHNHEFHHIEERRGKKFITISCLQDHEPFEMGWNEFIRKGKTTIRCPDCISIIPENISTQKDTEQNREDNKELRANAGSYSKEDLTKMVSECGYTLLNEERRRCADRVRRYISVRCPNSHEYDVLWDNFSPKGGKPKKGCSTCHHTKIGESKRLDIDDWIKDKGITLLSPYKSKTEILNWECQKSNHHFSASFEALRQRKVLCTLCFLDEVQDTKQIKLITENVDNIDVTTPLSWECLRCKERFNISVISFGRKKKICPNCA